MAKANDTTRLFIKNHFELFTALVGTPDDHRYKFPCDSNVLHAIDNYLDRQIYSNALAIEAIGQIFREASIGYYGVEGDNNDEAFLVMETRALMGHMSILAGQIKDNREIRQTLSVELQHRQT